MSCKYCKDREAGKVTVIMSTPFGIACRECGELIPVLKNSTKEKQYMMHEFPHHTLHYIQDLVTQLDKTTNKVKLANTINLQSEIFSAKVSSWALELRLGATNDEI